jgi:translation initiation factor 3 subunit D
LVNLPSALVDEATLVNNCFIEQASRTEASFNFGTEKLDWIDESKHIPVGYRYRKWDIDASIELVGRIQVDAVTDGEDESKPTLVNLKCLNEIDPRATGVDWRQKIDSQKSAIFTMEFSNNSNKLSKWTFQAILGSIDIIRMGELRFYIIDSLLIMIIPVGFVTRAMTKDSSKHILLGTHLYIPSELAKQMNIDMRNGWGIVKTFIKYFAQLEDGTYVLCKDPDLTKVIEVAVN